MKLINDWVEENALCMLLFPRKTNDTAGGPRNLAREGSSVIPTDIVLLNGLLLWQLVDECPSLGFQIMGFVPRCVSCKADCSMILKRQSKRNRADYKGVTSQLPIIRKQVAVD